MQATFRGADCILKSANYKLIFLRALKTKTITTEKNAYSSASINFSPQLISVKPDPQRFDDLSSVYEPLISVNTFGQHLKWRKSLAKGLAPFDNMKILDAACGTGLTTIAMLNQAAEAKCKSNFSITLCDQSPLMMKVGQDKIKQRKDYNDLVTFVQTDVHNLPFKNDTFDVAVFTFSFRAGVDIYAVFKELSRVVKPGGRVGIMDFCHSNRPTTCQRLYIFFLDHIFSTIADIMWKQHDAGHYMADIIRKSPSEIQVVEMLKSVGFHQVATKSFMGGVNYHYIGQKI